MTAFLHSPDMPLMLEVSGASVGDLREFIYGVLDRQHSVVIDIDDEAGTTVFLNLANFRTISITEKRPSGGFPGTPTDVVTRVMMHELNEVEPPHS